MKKSVLLITCLFMILTLTLAYAEVIGTDDKDVKAIADPIMDNILAGMKDNNYNKYSKDFDNTMKAALDKNKFAEAQKQISTLMGNYTSRQYLGFINQSNMTLIMWKGAFDKTKDDVLMQLTLIKSGNKYLVVGLWFK